MKNFEMCPCGCGLPARGVAHVPVSDEVVPDGFQSWFRKDRAIKQVMDVTKSVRVFLENIENVEKVSMLQYARLMYIKHATRPGIADDYAAISSMDDVYRFLDKHDCPAVEDEPTLTMGDVEQALALGLVTEAQADEMRELLKDTKENK